MIQLTSTTEREFVRPPTASTSTNETLASDLLDLDSAIIWTSEQAAKMPLPANVAWIPSKDVRTYDAYIQVSDSVLINDRLARLSFSVDMLDQIYKHF